MPMFKVIFRTNPALRRLLAGDFNNDGYPDLILCFVVAAMKVSMALYQ